MSWIWPVLAGLVASAGAVAGAGLILALGARAERAASWLLAFAVGTLLGAATLLLLPEALEQGGAAVAPPWFLGGMLAFILMERAIRWRHPHEPHPGEPPHPEVGPATAAMILWGDAVHNFTDGLALGASFRAGGEAGLAAAIAVVAHEVPQEIGDFAVLLAAGLPRGRAFLLNWLASLTPIPGALLAFAGAGLLGEDIGWLLAAAAGGFVYIALADLVPALQHRRGLREAALQIALIAAGVGAIAAIRAFRGAHGHGP